MSLVSYFGLKRRRIGMMKTNQVTRKSMKLKTLIQRLNEIVEGNEDKEVAKTIKEVNGKD